MKERKKTTGRQLRTFLQMSSCVLSSLPCLFAFFQFFFFLRSSSSSSSCVLLVLLLVFLHSFISALFLSFLQLHQSLSELKFYRNFFPQYTKLHQKNITRVGKDSLGLKVCLRLLGLFGLIEVSIGSSLVFQNFTTGLTLLQNPIVLTELITRLI